MTDQNVVVLSPVGFLVIGAGPAGISAAESYRKAGGHGRVVVLTADPDAPYARPPLSKAYLRSEVGAEELTLAGPAELEDLGVELIRTGAARLDPLARRVLTTDGMLIEFGHCLIATGSDPAPLPVPGGDLPQVLQLRTLADCHRLQDAARAATLVVVIGSGFVGCEAAVSLARMGRSVVQVSLEELPQQDRLGGDAGERIAAWLAEEGIEFAGGSAVASIEPMGGTGSVVVTLQDGRSHTADLVLAASGNRPNTQLATDAGLPVRNGRIVTDSQMCTPMDGVLAAGDVVLAQNMAAGRPLIAEHWGEALAMGEVAGSVAAGVPRSWAAAPGFWSEIGDRMLKHVAWGDGFATAEIVDGADDAFTIWYRDAAGVVVGVLTHDADEDYELGRRLIESADSPSG